VSAVNGDGSPREPFLDRLESLIGECDRRGMIVDVTLSRQNGVSGPPRLMTLDHHRRAVETLVTKLKPWRNWYLDLGNERNIRDSRFVPDDDLRQLRERAKELDSKRLITASHSSGDDDFIGEIEDYIKSIGVDFVTNHRGRYAGSAGETEAATRRSLERLRELGRMVPVHYQEPFRRGYADWEPTAEDFVRDLRGAIKSAAAGWCLHNGAQGRTAEPNRRRSFDLRSARLYDQLDEVEKTVVKSVRSIVKSAEERTDTPSRAEK
jgi:hypothetical protein